MAASTQMTMIRPGAELIDQAAGKRRAEAHHELGQRHRQAERLAADIERLGDGGR